MNAAAITNIIFLSIIAGLATVIGAWLGHHFYKGKSSLVFGMSFAGTLMILISFFELLPATIKESNWLTALLSAAAGVLIILILNIIIPHIHTVRDIKNYQNRGLIKLSYLIATGLILHDFPEGFAIANSYAYSSSLGLLVAASLFFHNLPEGYVLSACTSRHAPKNHFYQLAFLSVISTFLGTLAGILLLGANSALNPLLTAAAAGTMIYISLHELLPMSFKLKHLKQFFMGIITAVMVFIFLTYFINF